MGEVEISASDLARTLEQSLKAAGAPGARPQASPEDFADAAAIELLSLAQPGVPRQRRIDAKLFDRTTLFAIPDDELKLMPTLVTAVFNAFAKGPGDALPELFGLLVRYRRLRVEITAQEAAVLRTLKQAKAAKLGPLTAAQIGDRLRSDGLAASVDVPAVLDALVAKATDTATLVSTANGRWLIGNV